MLEVLRSRSEYVTGPGHWFDGIGGRKVKFVMGDQREGDGGERVEYNNESGLLERVEHFKTDASQGDPYKITYFKESDKNFV